MPTPIVSAQDGPRMTTTIRPGSIPSGAGRGKFPITSQKSVQSAARLIGHAKGVSKKRVAKHIIAAAKAKGLKVPSSVRAHAHSNEAAGDVELGFRFRHGWIPVGPVEGHKEYRVVHARSAETQLPGFDQKRSIGVVMHSKDGRVGHVSKVDGGFRVQHVYGSSRDGGGKSGDIHKTAQSAVAAIITRHHAANSSVKLSNDDTDLAGKWRHGWVPLDATAMLVKAKKFHGGPSGKSRIPSHSLPSGPGRTKKALAKDRIKGALPSGERSDHIYDRKGNKVGHITEMSGNTFVAHHHGAGEDKQMPSVTYHTTHLAAAKRIRAEHQASQEFKSNEKTQAKARRVAAITAHSNHGPSWTGKDHTIAARNADGSHTVIAQVSHKSATPKTFSTSDLRSASMGTDADLKRQHAFALAHGQKDHEARAAAELTKRGHTLNAKTGKWNKASGSHAARREGIRADIAAEQAKHPVGSRVTVGDGLQHGVVVKHLPTGHTRVKPDGMKEVGVPTSHLRQSGEGRKSGVGTVKVKAKAPSKDTPTRAKARENLTARLAADAKKVDGKKAQEFKPGDKVHMQLGHEHLGFTKQPNGESTFNGFSPTEHRVGSVTHAAPGELHVVSTNPVTGKQELHVQMPYRGRALKSGEFQKADTAKQKEQSDQAARMHAAALHNAEPGRTQAHELSKERLLNHHGTTSYNQAIKKAEAKFRAKRAAAKASK